MEMDLKQQAKQHIEDHREQLIGLSHRLHAHPELAFHETRSVEAVAALLAAAGFEVETGIGGLETALAARAGSAPLHVAICAEYDALPGIGHACGHNMIAAMAVGAGIGLLEMAHRGELQVSVLGTPAEEGGGGKITMLENGAFDGVHAAMMVHPAPFDVAEQPMIAAQNIKLRYLGKSAHASAFPELGINAADALLIAQTSIGLLRQHLRPGDRVHGITTRGGHAPNIIPELTEAHYIVRAETIKELDGVRLKVERCFQAGALATGATLELVPEPAYAEVRHDHDMAMSYRRNAEALGRRFPDLGEAAMRARASTDMGNVSLVIPSIHPAIGLGSFPISNHQPEFTALCATPTADQAVMDGAIAMAWTAIDLAAEGPVRDRLLHRSRATATAAW
jgi:amidohydrolase